MPNPTTPTRATAGDFSAALDELTEELLRIEARDLIAVNIDVSTAALAAIGVAEKLGPHRPAMVEWFGEEMAVHADRLEQAALAAWGAHGRYHGVVTGTGVPALSAAALEQRALLLADVQMLVAKKVIPAEVLTSLQGIHGFKNQCFDILALVSALQQSWDDVQRHTRLEHADLVRAEAIARQLATAVGTRDQAGTSPAAFLRQRAFTHFVRTYNQIRRMLAFLRFEEGDAELIAPSLWTGRGGRKRRAIADGDPGRVGLAPGGERTATVGPGMPGEHPFVDA